MIADPGDAAALYFLSSMYEHMATACTRTTVRHSTGTAAAPRADLPVSKRVWHVFTESDAFLLRRRIQQETARKYARDDRNITLDADLAPPVYSPSEMMR